MRANLERLFRDVRMQNADAPLAHERELRAELARVCADARRSGLRAEQLLVLIKDVWSSLPAGISRVHSIHGDERLNYVISACVDEYYGSDAGGDAADAADSKRAPREVEP